MSSIVADRNLLFGVLALQMDFVDQSALVAGMHAWVLRKADPLGQILQDLGAIQQCDRDLIEALVNRHVQMHANDARQSLAALGASCPALPDLESLADPDLQDSLVLLSTEKPPNAPHERQTLHSAGPAAHAEDGYSLRPLPYVSLLPSATPAAPGPRSGTAMRFRRLREHARGGLGEVSVALDEELNREVALKEIQARYAHLEESRTRFLREAEVTANLEHPGVVPVYGLGTYPDGRPYYAMRFIRGLPMSAAIERFHELEAHPQRDPAERSLAQRDLLTRFVAVCQAVAYAHHRGVIHRDIKPGNVMLGDYGETLVVDWGLARTVQPTTSSQTISNEPVQLGLGGGETLTREGKAAGTPSFMPPEQALGQLDRIGPASDVFALGATLYCLLTGKPPYLGVDALEHASEADWLPARKVNAAVPPALEAVCARAMAKHPEDRYPSAKALAADVQRWLADEPVSVYREPIRKRLGRWVRRHRTKVTVGVVLLAASVLALGAGLWFVRKEQAETAKALTQAEANLALAQQAVDECFNVVTKDPVFNQPGLKPAQSLLLKKTLPFYQEFRARQTPGRDWQKEEALQLVRAATIEGVIGHHAEAVSAYRRAQDLYERLLANRSGDHQLENDLASVHHNMAIHLDQLGQQDQANAAYLAAVKIRVPLTEVHPDIPVYQHDLAGTLASLNRYEDALAIQKRLVENYPGEVDYEDSFCVTLNNMASVLWKQAGNRKEAARLYRKILGIREQLLVRWPESSHYRKSLATTRYNLALLLLELSEGKEVLELLHGARAHLEKLVVDHPDAPDYRFLLSEVHQVLGSQLRKENRLAQAIEQYRRALELQVRLVQDHKEIVAHRVALAMTRNSLGILYQEARKNTEAIDQYLQARDELARLVKEYPDRLKAMEMLGGVHHGLGVLYQESRQPDRAVPEFKETLRIQRRLVADHPGRDSYRASLGNTLNNLGNAKFLLGKSHESLRFHLDALAIRSRLAREHPEVPEYPVEVAHSRQALAESLRDLGKTTEAIQQCRLARDQFAQLLREKPQDSTLLAGLAEAHNGLGLVLAKSNPGEAEKEYREAVIHYVRLVREHGGSAKDRASLARVHSNLGLVLRGEPAIKEFRVAQGHYQQLVKQWPEDIEYLRCLAGACYSLGEQLKGLNKPREAIQEYRPAIVAYSRLVELPGGAKFRDSLAVTYNNLGLLLSKFNRTLEAEEHYRQAIRWRLALLHDEPGNSLNLYDLAGTRINLGDLLSGTRAFPEAVAEFRQAVEILTALAAEFPGETRYRIRAGITLNTLGVLAQRQDNAKQARADYRYALTLFSRLSAAEPASRQVRNGLADLYHNFATLYDERGEKEAALKLYDYSCAIRRKLVAEQPGERSSEEELARTRRLLAGVQLSLGRPMASLVVLDDMIAQADRLESHPGCKSLATDIRELAIPQRAEVLTRLGQTSQADQAWEQALRVTRAENLLDLRLRRATARALAGDHVRAAAEADDLDWRPGVALYNLACVHALSAAGASRDTKRPLPWREKQAEQHAAQALDLLRRARATGYFHQAGNVAHLDRDPDLDFLRAREDFQTFRRGLNNLRSSAGHSHPASIWPQVPGAGKSAAPL